MQVNDSTREQPHQAAEVRGCIQFKSWEVVRPKLEIDFPLSVWGTVKFGVGISNKKISIHLWISE
jgi:hypothetical protein